ncbi:MAG TPA: SulP family inorganic anion transporter, partial [Jatrophihabitans sp.]|nr:SulP family inorganic anion transporter [Jatrophihabitans sp.]
MDRLVPGIEALRTYRRAWLPRDLGAGIVLATLLVPQGMAYAELAGLPPITGLYTTVLCLIGYAIFGPSRILVLGPDSALGPMIAATLAPLVVAAEDPKRAVALASALALMDGLILVLAAILAVQVFDLAAHGVQVIGVLPRGFPPFTLPRVGLSDIGPLVGGAFGIALVSLADTISNATSFAGRTGQEVHGDGEMRGIGAANLAAAFFQGFPVSTSASRTAVAQRAGAKTQLTGVVGAAVIVLLIVLLPGLFRNLPQPALAAVVITAALSMVDLPGLNRLWRQHRTEWLVSMTAMLSVVLLGVLPGVAIAVGLSILNVFRRLWRPYDTVLGRVTGVPGYHDVRSYPAAELLPGLVIFRFDAPLIFANATTFRGRVRELAADL